jgi:hypothetical protein
LTLRAIQARSLLLIPTTHLGRRPTTVCRRIPKRLVVINEKLIIPLYIYLEVKDDEVDIGRTLLLHQSKHDHPTCPLLHSLNEGGPPPCEGRREHSEDCGEQISAL